MVFVFVKKKKGFLNFASVKKIKIWGGWNL